MEAVEAYAEVLSWYLRLITEEKHEISHSVLVGATAKARTVNLLNTNQVFKRFGGKFCFHLQYRRKLHTFLTPRRY